MADVTVQAAPPLIASRGPFTGGYTSSILGFMARPDQLIGNTDGTDSNSSRDVFIDPFTGGVSKRSGASILNDTTSSGGEVTGLLNAKWNAKCRKLFAIDSGSLADNYPTIGALYSNDPTNTGFPAADSGWPGTIYLNSTNSGASTNALKNHSLLEEFLNNTTYSNSPGSKATAADYRLKVVPIWYESGDGVYNRGALTGVLGTDQFMQQYLACGARSLLQTQSWLYSPNLRATPWRWNKRFNESAAVGSEIVRIFPTGPFPPLFPPTATTPSPASSNTSWTSGDTYYLSVMFIFEDGSYSAPFIPRATNAILDGSAPRPAGLGLVTVDAVGNSNKYQYMTYSNIPLGWDGVVGRVILRSVKQNRTASTDVITVSPLDLRVVGVLRNNTQKTYVDYAGDDNSLVEDNDTVRFDGFVPRRARYIGSGDQRAIIGHTLPNTAAIMLAPIGVTTDKDRNFVDTDDNCYGTTGSYVRITSTDLELHYNSAAGTPAYNTYPTVTAGANNAVKIPLGTYTTLEQVVDAINSLTSAADCQQWAAQLVPGIDPTMPSASLTKTTLSISCDTHSNATTTSLTSTAAFGPVGIGMKVSGTGITAGTYVVSKVSDSSIVISSPATDHTTNTRIFYQNTGDTESMADGSLGYMRAFSSTFPLLLHMKPSAFPDYQVPDKQSVYFTVASPGAATSGVSMAPNSFVLGNRRIPDPSPKAQMPRLLMGIVDVEGAAIVAYSDSIFMLRNQKGVNTGEDMDVRLFTINLTRGCISYLGLTAGHGWAAWPTTEGIMCTDKNGQEYCLSGDIFNPSDGKGDLAYEIKTSGASASSDSDDQYFGMAVQGSKLAVSIRQFEADPRVIYYDFSPGVHASGVEQLIDPDTKRAYIWTPPAIYDLLTNLLQIGGMGSIRNASGRVDYISFDSNAGTGDGRIEIVNTGTSDLSGLNSTVTSYAVPAPVVASEFKQLMPVDMEVTHVRSDGSSGASQLLFANDQLPTFSSTLVRTLPKDANLTQFQKQIVPIDAQQKGVCDLFWLQWKSTVNSVASRVWRIVVRYTEVNNSVKAQTTNAP